MHISLYLIKGSIARNFNSNRGTLFVNRRVPRIKNILDTMSVSVGGENNEGSLINGSSTVVQL